LGDELTGGGITAGGITAGGTPLDGVVGGGSGPVPVCVVVRGGGSGMGAPPTLLTPVSVRWRIGGGTLPVGGG